MKSERYYKSQSKVELTFANFPCQYLSWKWKSAKGDRAMSNTSPLLPGYKAISLLYEPFSAPLHESASKSLKRRMHWVNISRPWICKKYEQKHKIQCKMCHIKVSQKLIKEWAFNLNLEEAWYSLICWYCFNRADRIAWRQRWNCPFTANTWQLMKYKWLWWGLVHYIHANNILL